MINYAALIRKKRLEMNISQNRLAKLVGITQAFMSQIESGQRSPSVEVLFQICEILEIKVFPD